MNEEAERRRRLDCVEQSPRYVAAHDKAGWLSLFAAFHRVEDPIGSAPVCDGFDGASGVRGNGALARFYEAFIAANTIRFQVQRDLVNGDVVVRDLSIEIAMAPRVQVLVPMHLVYRLTPEDGTLKIQQLAAHWELVPMVRQLMTCGVAALPVSMAMGARLLRQLGVGGLIGFMRAARSIGEAGKRQVNAFVNAVNGHHTAQLTMLMSGAPGGICLPNGLCLRETAAVLQWLSDLRCHKLLAAGNIVSASMEGVIDGVPRHAVFFFEFSLRTKKLHRIDAVYEPGK